MADNVKFMVDSPQRACGNFFIINELCMLARVQSHPDELMVSLILPINKVLCEESQHNRQLKEDKTKHNMGKINSNNNNMHLIVCNNEKSMLWAWSVRPPKWHLTCTVNHPYLDRVTRHSIMSTWRDAKILERTNARNRHSHHQSFIFKGKILAPLISIVPNENLL